MATLTVTVPDAQVPRVQTAVGQRLNLVDGNGDPRDATAEEVRQLLVQYLKDITFYQERTAAAETAKAGVSEIGAT